MTIAEIIILVVGALLFTVSFFIPDKGGETTGGISRATEEKVVKEMVEKEVAKFRYNLEEAAEESINDNRDKMERAMDRLTNEKMMAINEYSDNVLEKIHKNHEEAMFLYDMLNNKHSQVKTTAAELNQLEKSVRNIQNEQVNAPKTEDKPKLSLFGRKEPVKKVQPAEETVAETVKTESPKVDFEPIAAPIVEMEDKKEEEKPKKKAAPKAKKAVSETVDETSEPKKAEEASVTPVIDAPSADSGIELMFASDSEDSNNNKDRIIALHDAGKSNMAIAKELGLGIGEVKLVLDLYQA